MELNQLILFRVIAECRTRNKIFLNEVGALASVTLAQCGITLQDFQ